MSTDQSKLIKEGTH